MERHNGSEDEVAISSTKSGPSSSFQRRNDGNGYIDETDAKESAYREPEVEEGGSSVEEESDEASLYEGAVALDEEIERSWGSRRLTLSRAEELYDDEEEDEGEWEVNDEDWELADGGEIHFSRLSNS